MKLILIFLLAAGIAGAQTAELHCGPDSLRLYRKDGSTECQKTLPDINVRIAALERRVAELEKRLRGEAADMDRLLKALDAVVARTVRQRGPHESLQAWVARVHPDVDVYCGERLPDGMIRMGKTSCSSDNMAGWICFKGDKEVPCESLK